MMQIHSAINRRIIRGFHPFLFSSSSSSRGTKIIDQQVIICRRRRQLSTSSGGKGDKEDGSMHVLKAGVPMFLFCGLGVWVVSSGIEGKNKERDAFQGRISKSDRQAVMDKEHDEMMDKLNHIMKEDFDNTKRIERPDEVLERRRKERKAKNVWYKRIWRGVTGQQ